MISERRQAPRYPLIAAVGGLEKGEGMTRDVSATGVFFLCDAGYAVGEVIGFYLELEDRDHAQPLRIDAKGRVVRVEPCDGKWGIAVNVTSIRFGAEGWPMAGERGGQFPAGDGRSAANIA